MKPNKHLSHSQLNTFDACKKRYFYNYVQNIVPKVRKKALTHGSLFHSAMEVLYKTGDLAQAVKSIDKEILALNKTFFEQKDYDDLDWTELVVKAQLRGYYEIFYAHDIKAGYKSVEIEKEYDVTIINPETNVPSRKFIYRFIADRVVRDSEGKLWLVEYKTASKLGQSYFDRLSIDNQITGMLYYLQQIYKEKFEGIIYRVMKKPGIKQTQKESRSGFFARLSNEFMKNPDKYFVEEILVRDVKAFDEFKQDLWAKQKEVQGCINTGIYPKSTANCVSHFGTCEYMPLCTKEFNALDKYEERKDR